MNYFDVMEKDNLLLKIYEIIRKEDNKTNKIEDIIKLFENSKAFNKLLDFERRSKLGKLDIQLNGFKDEDRTVEEIEAQLYKR
jgi:hypothetical protein